MGRQTTMKRLMRVCRLRYHGIVLTGNRCILELRSGVLLKMLRHLDLSGRVMMLGSLGGAAAVYLGVVGMEAALPGIESDQTKGDYESHHRDYGYVSFGALVLRELGTSARAFAQYSAIIFALLNHIFVHSKNCQGCHSY